jgi:type VI secretion system protein ImpF
MAGLSLQERLQPSLLDRLTDESPEAGRESANQRVLTVRKLRDCVLRDLTWLLNSVNLGNSDWQVRYPRVASSVLNYGLPDLAGLTTSIIDAEELARMVRQIIWDFEPRILRHTLQVRVGTAPQQTALNSLTFEIRGEVWAQPVPLELLLKTELDLETGSINVVEQLG